MWPSFGSPLALPWPIKPAPRFPATTIQLKNHLSLAVRLGMGDYKQLWKRLTGDCCLTALWPSRHYWGPFSWLSSSADRYTVVVTGNWGGGAGRSSSWLCVSSVGEIKKKKKSIGAIKRKATICEGWGWNSGNQLSGCVHVDFPPRIDVAPPCV